jgi:DNA-binding beta-propeller fold protein YncE
MGAVAGWGVRQAVRRRHPWRDGARLRDPTRFRLLARFPLPGRPYGIATDARRDRLWVTLTATNQVVALWAARRSPRTLAAYATGRQPNAVAVDPRSGRVFVADTGAAAVQLIDPRR